MALHQQTHPSLNVEGCFGCKAAGLALTFRYGRENFHGDCIPTVLADMRKRAAENGRTIESASRWV